MPTTVWAPKLPLQAVERHLATVDVVGPWLCWLLDKTPHRNGYMYMASGTGRHCRQQLAHRAVYEHLIGPIPDELTIDHLCRNRWCCHPNHVVPVTSQVNALRGLTGMHNKVKSHCPQGHPYTGDNLYIRPRDNARSCRTCTRAAIARFRSKRRKRP